jgi:hypothetical protein
MGGEGVLGAKVVCANGDVAQKPATHFSRQKSATNGCEAANPLLNSTPSSSRPCLLWAGVGVKRGCSRLKFLRANGDVAQKPATPFCRQKGATNGCEAGSRAKKQGLPYPLAQLPPLQPRLSCGLWREVVCLWQRIFVQMVVWRKSRQPRSVGKKARPMDGCKVAKSKANPLLNPLLLCLQAVPPPAQVVLGRGKGLLTCVVAAPWVGLLGGEQGAWHTGRKARPMGTKARAPEEQEPT